MPMSEAKHRQKRRKRSASFSQKLLIFPEKDFIFEKTGPIRPVNSSKPRFFSELSFQKITHYNPSHYL